MEKKPILCSECGTTKTSTNYLWNVWNQQSEKIKGTEFTLMGFSVAALRTNFFVRELNVMFDAGLSSNYSPTNIFLTHCHSDHFTNLGWHFNPADKKNAYNDLLFAKQFINTHHVELHRVSPL